MRTIQAQRPCLERAWDNDCGPPGEGGDFVSVFCLPIRVVALRIFCGDDVAIGEGWGRGGGGGLFMEGMYVPGGGEASVCKILSRFVLAS